MHTLTEPPAPATDPQWERWLLDLHKALFPERYDLPPTCEWPTSVLQDLAGPIEAVLGPRSTAGFRPAAPDPNGCEPR